MAPQDSVEEDRREWRQHSAGHVGLESQEKPYIEKQRGHQSALFYFGMAERLTTI
jgi:hypothetical protein